MKRVLFGLLALASLSLATGCSTVGNCGAGGCGDGCGPAGCGSAGGGLLGHGGMCADGSEFDPCHPRLRPLKRAGGRHGGYDAGAYGPPTAAIAYPYYTTRGPRDFFEPNPPSIGY
ncbi:MAG: hypothetical protein DCC68_00340 [Planctomycetota bacterium]|nr:MAG: hypothetical protein DCC68_00340 [Planctomycetota bacterium]